MQYFIPVQPVLDCCLTAVYAVNQKLVLLYKKKRDYVRVVQNHVRY